MQPSRLDSLRFKFERNLAHRLMRDPRVQAASNPGASKLNFTSRARSLLGNAVKITPGLIPDLYALYQECLAMVGGGLEGDLFIQQQMDYNASVCAIGHRFDIVISSAIIKDFTRKEVAFVIGHELGHVMFEHMQIPVRVILGAETGVTYTLAQDLFQWSRASEISADRVGLLCSGDLSSAASGFFKLSSGLSVDRIDAVIQSFQQQFDAIQKLASSTYDPRAWIGTHPLVPIRFKGLELIALDILALRHRKGAGAKGFEGVDDLIADVLQSTEPVSVTTLLKNRDELARFVLVLVYIAVADKVLVAEEEEFVLSVLAESEMEIGVNQLLLQAKNDPGEIRRSAIGELKSAGRWATETSTKVLTLAHALAVIDGPLVPEEARALSDVGAALGCDRAVVEKIVTGR
jgi:tellurite resistance protein